MTEQPETASGTPEGHFEAERLSARPLLDCISNVVTKKQSLEQKSQVMPLARVLLNECWAHVAMLGFLVKQE